MKNTINKQISLTHNTIDESEISKLIEWLSLKPTPQLTKGVKTLEVEQKWAKMIGTKYGCFVNSGSSAILLMLHALIVSQKIKVGDRVLLNSLCWATDYSSIEILNLKPILVDSNLKDLSVDLEHLETLLIKEKPKVLLLVSVLGLVPQMDIILELCKKHNCILLEDCCESLFSSYNGKKLGTFGLMSCFSTYYSHHITSVEGGMICTNDQHMQNICVMCRSHGWSRDISEQDQASYKNAYNISDFNNLYTFYYPGLNVRNHEIGAFLAINQLDKLENLVKIRNQNYNFYNEFLKNDYWKPSPVENSFTSNMAYPIIHPKREQIVQALKDNNVEVRPLIAGSMGKQPMYTDRYGVLELPNVSIVDKYGFYVPNHQEMTEEDVKRVCEIINSVISG